MPIASVADLAMPDLSANAPAVSGAGIEMSLKSSQRSYGDVARIPKALALTWLHEPLSPMLLRQT